MMQPSNNPNNPKNMNNKTILLTAALTLTGAAALAQYSVNWFKIAGGGGTSSGGNYALSGTIGQADAGGPLTGGNYSLTGGFWAAVTLIQEPGSPELTMITNVNGSRTVRWPSPSPGYFLQQSTDLTPAGWTNSTYPVSDDGTFRFITFSPPSGRLFFRLIK